MEFKDWTWFTGIILGTPFIIEVYKGNYILWLGLVSLICVLLSFIILIMETINNTNELKKIKRRSK